MIPGIVRNLLPTILFRKYATNPVSKLAPLKFKTAVKEAEKVVGYPTSFLNLRWLLNDEIANIASHIRKLIHVNHPLLETAREVILQSDAPTWGLIVLLVSKAGGLKDTNAVDIDHNAGILHSQRVLAEVSEMIRTSMLFHQGLLNATPTMKASKDIAYGNKIALLCGDYLLSKCYHDLANIKDHDVNELIASTLRDLTENEFLGEHDAQNFPLPTRPRTQQSPAANLIADLDMGPYEVDAILGHCKPEWHLRSILGGANLLGKTCRATCLLTKQDDSIQEAAFLLGKFMALAWQVKVDVEVFHKKQFAKYFLVSAPVMCALSKCPEMYSTAITKGAQNIGDCDFDHIHDIVCKAGVLDDCRQMQHDLIRQAKTQLCSFPPSTAIKSLNDLLDSIALDERGKE